MPVPHDRPLLATRDYDEAIARFVADAVHAVMAASDPIFASLRRVPLPEGVTTVRVQAGRAVTDSPEVTMTKTVEIRLEDVVGGELESMHAAIAQIAEAHLLQFMRPFFEHVGDAAEAVGNAMEFQGDDFAWDGLLDAYERVEWVADRSGRVRPPQIAAGREAAERINRLPESRG